MQAERDEINHAAVLEAPACMPVDLAKIRPKLFLDDILMPPAWHGCVCSSEQTTLLPSTRIIATWSRRTRTSPASRQSSMHTRLATTYPADKARAKSYCITIAQPQACGYEQ
ncbi:hypothetical protein H257_18930, partial [Aphanomyces astaci]